MDTVKIVVKGYRTHVELVTFVNGEVANKSHYSRSWWVKTRKAWDANSQNYTYVKMF